MAVDDDVIAIEVVYALPGRQSLVALTVPRGTTACVAVALSGLRQTHSDIGAIRNQLGIFGKRVSADTVLNNGDRVEIYRELTADPKEARRRRARKPG
jgi:putative ubiquitin-RnfH superfamily antitoxin RatB of RatAB toxin-antitoxin module